MIRMKIEKIMKTKNEIQIEVTDINETMLYALREKLISDDMVEFTNFFRGHPLLEVPNIYVKVSSGKPQTALKRASKSLGNDYKKLRERFLKACAKYESEN
jgi:DNA-directed RNA polymerase subunit L